MFRSRMIAWGCLFVLCGVPAQALEVKPFKTKNQSPVAHFYGLPAVNDGEVARPGDKKLEIGLDITNNFTGDIKGNELVIFDGEMYRYEIVARTGFSSALEGGFVIPLVRHSGGIFDDFIESFHDLFGLPEGGRLSAPHDRIIYRYIKNGQTKIDMTNANEGVGDISLFGGYRLFHEKTPAPRSAALRFSLKLPTGESADLRGSGSTDFALYISGSDANALQSYKMTYYGEIGGMYATDGDVLPDQRRNFVGFATVGLGWQPWDSLLFKVQFDAHTPFYKDSSLKHFSAGPIGVVIGGSLGLPGEYYLDIGVVEDVVLDTVPDVTFHFNLRKTF